MNIETIDTINIDTSTTLSFIKIMDNFPNNPIQLWFPKNYNNKINNQSGNLTLSYNGLLQFSVNQLQNGYFKFFNQTVELIITLRSKYNEKYPLVSNYPDKTTIVHDYNEPKMVNQYTIKLPIDKLNYTFSIQIDNPNTFEWEIKVKDTKEVVLGIQFLPNYKTIMFNLHKQKKQTKKREKQLTKKNKKISRENILLQETNDIMKCKKKSSQIVVEILQKKNKDLHSKLKSIEKENNSFSTVNLELQKFIDTLENVLNNTKRENTMFRTNLLKYRNENKSLVTQLHKCKQTNKKVMKEHNENKQINLKNTEKLNKLTIDLKEMKTLNEYFISENKLLEKERKLLKTENDLHNTNKLLITELKNELTTKKNTLVYLESSYNNIQSEVINKQLKLTEYEIKIENLKKKKIPLKSIKTIKDIFKWYKYDAMPPKKTIKLNKNELQEYIQNLEDEIIHVLDNKKQFK